MRTLYFSSSYPILCFLYLCSMRFNHVLRTLSQSWQVRFSLFPPGCMSFRCSCNKSLLENSSLHKRQTNREAFLNFVKLSAERLFVPCLVDNIKSSSSCFSDGLLFEILFSGELSWSSLSDRVSFASELGIYLFVCIGFRLFECLDRLCSINCFLSWNFSLHNEQFINFSGENEIIASGSFSLKLFSNFLILILCPLTFNRLSICSWFGVPSSLISLARSIFPSRFCLSLRTCIVSSSWLILTLVLLFDIDFSRWLMTSVSNCFKLNWLASFSDTKSSSSFSSIILIFSP